MAVHALGMNHRKQLPRLRMYRRQWQLTLRELGLLLGFRSSAHVSRIEQGKRTPSSETALACTAIFGVSLHELFPELMRGVRTRTKVRALRFRKGLEQGSTPSITRKRDLVDEVITRTEETTNERTP